MFNDCAEFFFLNFSVANMAEDGMQCGLQTMQQMSALMHTTHTHTHHDWWVCPLPVAED